MVAVGSTPTVDPEVLVRTMLFSVNWNESSWSAGASLRLTWIGAVKLPPREGGVPTPVPQPARLMIANERRSALRIPLITDYVSTAE